MPHIYIHVIVPSMGLAHARPNYLNAPIKSMYRRRVNILSVPSNAICNDTDKVWMCHSLNVLFNLNFYTHFFVLCTLFGPLGNNFITCVNIHK